MKEIKLSQGKIALVDADDFEWLNQWKWSYARKEGSLTGYAFRRLHSTNNKREAVPLHRLIMDLKYGDIRHVDHINGDGLDNRKCNLRVCSKAQNLRNRDKNKNNTSGYKGVFWTERDQKWYAKITYNLAQHYLGCYNTKEEAAQAYNKAAQKYHGEFALLNDVSKEG